MASPDFKPARAAGESGRTVVMTVRGFSIGIDRPAGVGSPTINPIEMRDQAKIKLPSTPARRTDAWIPRLLDWKLSEGAFEVDCSGFSPKIFTKPPKGNQLRVNGVPFQVNSFLARGGKPRPNSSTLMPNFLATRKCPSSWTIISALKITMKIRIDIRSLFRNLFFLL